MGDIYFSKGSISFLHSMTEKDKLRVFGVVERIRLDPERYSRKLILDPAYRIRIGPDLLYMDLSGEDIVVLHISRFEKMDPGSRGM